MTHGNVMDMFWQKKKKNKYFEPKMFYRFIVSYNVVIIIKKYRKLYKSLKPINTKYISHF